MIRTHTFTAKLSASVHDNLNALLHQLQQLWNAALQERIDAYRKFGISITWVDQFKSLTEIRQDEEFSQYLVNAQRSILKRLELAFQRFFARVKKGEKPGFPRFKPKHRVCSFEIPCPHIHRNGKWNSFFLKGIGRIRFKGDIPQGKCKVLRIVKTPLRVKVQIVTPQEVEAKEDTRPALGVDAGIKERMILSNGHAEPKNKVKRRKIRRKQRKLARAVKGSKSRAKKRAALAREWQRTREREKGKLHEITARWIKVYGAKYYIEDLKIQNMVKNHCLARSILEQQWGTFFYYLTYKARSHQRGEHEGRSPSHERHAGGWVIRVPPRNTSQRCCACGGMPSAKLTLDVRIYKCGHCGHEMCRDVNAANNVLWVGQGSDPPGGNIPVCRENGEMNRGGGSGRHGTVCLSSLAELGI